MADFNVTEISGLDELQRKLAAMPMTLQAAESAAIRRCGLLAKSEAVANAPRSPTMAQYSATLKRKKSTTRRLTPGGLEKSIEFQQTSMTEGMVYVAANSYAGKYAKRIHDEKGVSWRNRGVGTIAKGDRADEKFIERAMSDCHSSGAFRAIFEEEIQKVLPK